MIEKTRVVGVTFDGRQEVIADINPMIEDLVAIREPDNPYDPNALGVYVKKYNGDLISVGYVNRGLASKLSPLIDAGQDLFIHDYFITGSRTNGHNLGIIFSYSLTQA